MERLNEANSIIGKLCSDGRCPKMSIPVKDDDEDVFMCRTIKEAIDTITRLARENAREISDRRKISANFDKACVEFLKEKGELNVTITRMSQEIAERKILQSFTREEANAGHRAIAELEAQNKDKSQLLASFRINLDAARAERDKYRDMCAEYDKALETIEQGRTPGSGLHQTSATFAKSERKRIAGDV
ncbi:MAG: hypothetical protein GY938_32655 [Ketobacter sp.]|nr:hypothetical protein [Ketobacter sp.]